VFDLLKRQFQADLPAINRRRSETMYKSVMQVFVRIMEFIRQAALPSRGTQLVDGIDGNEVSTEMSNKEAIDLQAAVSILEERLKSEAEEVSRISVQPTEARWVETLVKGFFYSLFSGQEHSASRQAAEQALDDEEEFKRTFSTNESEGVGEDAKVSVR
jgi:hypothetical protein